MIDLTKRKYVDLTNLTLDGQKLPIVYVKSKIIWKSQEPTFQEIISELEAAPQPGFFLTSQKGDKEVRVRWHLNRHCILKSDIFYDSKGKLYRDIDAKGVGYTRGFPIRFLSVREPEMSGDMEMRGILHNDVAIEDCLNTEEIHDLGIRIARYIAQIELFELVNQKGEIVPRSYFNEKFWLDFDKVRPTIAIRAMGTTTRAYDLGIDIEINNKGYVKEILDDAISLVSLELNQKFSAKDYAIWLIVTMGQQLGKLHKNGVWTDFMAQIHGGMHNVTLDCRLTDTYHYQTPGSISRVYKSYSKLAKEDPEKYGWWLESRFPKNLTEEDIRKNNEEGERIDKERNKFVSKELVHFINEIYHLGNLKDEVEEIFEKAYLSER